MKILLSTLLLATSLLANPTYSTQEEVTSHNKHIVEKLVRYWNAKQPAYTEYTYQLFDNMSIVVDKWQTREAENGHLIILWNWKAYYYPKKIWKDRNFLDKVTIQLCEMDLIGGILKGTPDDLKLAWGIVIHHPDKSEDYIFINKQICNEYTY